MPSRADGRTLGVPERDVPERDVAERDVPERDVPEYGVPQRAILAQGAASTLQPLRIVGVFLHGIGLLCIVLLAWRLFLPRQDRGVTATVAATGRLEQSVLDLLRAPRETIDVTLDGIPDARTRAMLRAVRRSGHTLRIAAPHALAAVAVSAEQEWRASGSTRLQVVSSDPARQMVADAAGLIDSIAIDSTGLATRAGPLQGALQVGRAAAPLLVSTAPIEARVLVLGAATWESRFLIAALEESGWPVDAAVSLSPRVTITQGPARLPSRARHSIVVLLPGAPANAVALLPAFVRSGGGLVIVGDAARAAGLSSVRAGAPGSTLSGEMGAETSDQPRHGLDLVPITVLADGSVPLESRDGRVAIAARRLGAGRVIQVGYDNSWLWRMGGNDESPVAHRRWWTALLSGIVSQRAPVSGEATTPEHDTLDAAPLSALARDLGLPAIRTGSAVLAPSQSPVAALDPRWLLALALITLVSSWALRRWRGLA